MANLFDQRVILMGYPAPFVRKRNRQKESKEQNWKNMIQEIFCGYRGFSENLELFDQKNRIKIHTKYYKCLQEVLN